MTEYTVTWSINLDGENALDAAKQALAIQRDPGSSALVFMVERFDATPNTTRITKTMIDLEGRVT